ncbi:BamA/TamA family outer membrane protein [Agaribacterium sp. ZY112]|uniref:BamA/TamA family outer membrane protein n=1 Tax=Agaribacterium sp. ZY112 TaxID=3233574 RepID=UPI0035233741
MNIFSLRSLCTSALFLAAALSTQAADFFDPIDGQLDMSQFLSENAYGFLPVPIIITDPSVDGGLGMMGLFFHENEEDKEARLKAMQSATSNAGKYLMPPSVSAVAGVKTGNDSWFVGGGHMGFFKHGDIRYTGGGGYGDVNLDFYGSGSIQLQKPVEINTKATVVMQNLKFRLGKSNWFLGPTQQYINSEISPVTLGTIEDYLPPAWSEQLKKWLTVDVTTSALGAVLEYDSRDNIFTPTSGYQYQFNAKRFDEAIGSDIDYSLMSLQGLNYWPLSERMRVGLKVAGEKANADGFLPPFAMPSVSLRGIPAMRYQGMKVAMTEAEFGYGFTPRWRGLLFGGSGRAATSDEELFDSKALNTYGAGFRYQIARRYGFDMGMDFAEGPDGLVWYITAGSAWSGM